VTVSIDLTSFTREELETLNQRYIVPLNPSNLDQMFALIVGHPYLTRLAFYRLTAGPALSAESLFAKAANSDGPFGDHLRSRLFLLQRQPDLLDAMIKLAKKGTQPTEPKSHILTRIGLAMALDRQLVPANDVYRQFFGNLG
jgi:hypothetical protein